MEEEPSSTTKQEKPTVPRGPLESLTRDELVKKCKGLLSILKQAKQAKDAYTEENKHLTSKLSEYETQKEADKKSLMTMKEMVDILTENKLTLVSKISDLESQLDKACRNINELQETQTKYIDYSIENESLKRQNKRLTNENDQILQDLQNMEEKLQQVNEIGKIQKHELEELEKQTEKWQTLELKLIACEKENSILKIHLENSKVKSNDSEEFQIKLEELNSKLEMKTTECVRIREREEKYVSKVQHLKSKLGHIASKLQNFKNSKEILLQTHKDYSESVTKWQNDISRASQQLMDYIKLLEIEKTELKLLIKSKTQASDSFLSSQTKLETNDCMTTEENSQHKTYSFNDNSKKPIIFATSGDYLECIRNWELKTLKIIEFMNKLEFEHCEVIQIKENYANATALNNELEIQNEKMKQKTLKFEKNFDQQLLKIDEFSVIEQSLKQELGDLKESLKYYEKEKEELHNILLEKNGIIERMQYENKDLLAEMREFNEALKSRGDIISKQQNKISELESMLQNQQSETVSISDENTINSDKPSKKIRSFSSDSLHLQSEPDTNKNQDSQSEILSISSISKADHCERLKDVEESYEEKYKKIRIVALKLKKKVQEQANIILNLEKQYGTSSAKLNSGVQMKNFQALQNENDRLLDQIDLFKQEQKIKAKELEGLLNQNEVLKSELEKRDNEIEREKKLIFAKENEVKNLHSEIQLLKQEKEAFNVIKKEIEKESENLKKDLIAKEKEKQKYLDQLEKLKKEQEKLKLAGKQSNVLNLEIEAYEKSLNETAQKLEILKIKNKELIETVDCRDSTVVSLKKEIDILEQNNESEKTHSLELKHQIDNQQNKIKQIEFEKQEGQNKIQENQIEIERLKFELDEIEMKRSKELAEQSKICKDIKLESDVISQQFEITKNRMTEQSEKLKTCEQELEYIRTDYARYKVRAQSVLRQNQSKESSRERELEEELTQAQGNIEKLNLKLVNALEEIETNNYKIQDLQQENETIQKSKKDLIKLIDELRVQVDLITEDNRNQIMDYQESLKSNRLQIETLNNCYKKQIEEIEAKYSKELEEAKQEKNDHTKLLSRIGPFGGSCNLTKTSDEHKIDLILMEREDAEGSEASYGATKRKLSQRSKHDLVPLDELLNSSIDESPREYFIEDILTPEEDLKITKEKLNAEEIRTKHLTTLLADVEQDLVKRTQLNDMLKDELRRIERSIEREKHIQNSEYLKNVVLKFITLNNNDEKQRLVPVLNTILKLSPEETQAVQNVAKGLDGSNRWGNLLPMWPNRQ